MHLCDAHHALLHTEFCRIEDDRRRENSADRRSDVPAGTMDEASPLHALCCLMSESKHAGPDWSAASSLFHHGRVESADPEEKREPCERHRKLRSIGESLKCLTSNAPTEKPCSRSAEADFVCPDQRIRESSWGNMLRTISCGPIQGEESITHS